LQRALETIDVDYADARWQERKSLSIRITKGELESANFTRLTGTGIRVWKDGGWGFSSTNDPSSASLAEAAQNALRAAKIAALNKKEKTKTLKERRPAQGRFQAIGTDPLAKHSYEEKMAVVRETEAAIRKGAKGIVSSTAVWREIDDHKLIVSTDGARVELHYCKPDFYAVGVAKAGGQRVRAAEASGVTGGWKELFRKGSPEVLAERAARRATALAKAKHLTGGRATVILDPAVVGLISHEAVGHTVEADFVLAGSILKGKVGERVASDLVTLVDSGNPSEDAAAAGTIFADDEGTLSGRTVLIRKGILVGYLHDRETAGILGQPVTGNARAFEHTDEPIVRMTNTYILPGDWTYEEILHDTKEGYLVKGAGGGQADANGEFMFEVQEAYRVENGELGELYKSVTLSGQTFDLLKSVDAISREFAFDLGSGFCGKFQLARVDGGGGYLRCQAILGGRQGA